MSSDIFWIPGPWIGQLAVVTRPRGGDWLEDELKSWRNSGIQIVVSLLEEEEARQLDLSGESDAAASSGIQFISFPIPDCGVPTIRSAFESFSRITVHLNQGKNVAVHCRQGIGRSGLMAAGLLITSGMRPDQAVQVVTDARGQNIPETAPQLEWLRRLPAFEPILAG